MAQVNTCLKRIFTIFNIFFAIIGGLIILLTLLSQILSVKIGENLEERTYNFVFLYVVGAITMVIAILGAHGANKESRGCLIAFLVCMVTGSVVMLKVGIPLATTRPMIEQIIRERFQEFVPLDKASSDVKDMANTIQTQLHCCGIFSYQDWEENIPKSCECSPVEVEESICRSVNYRVFMVSRPIYSQPCFPILAEYIYLVVDIAIGVIFTLAALAVLGTILSSIIIHQMRKSTIPTMVLSVPTVFIPSPPKYQELQNSPPPYC